MIEQGLVMLIQAGIAGSFPACQGGFGGQLPENQAAPAYVYKFVSTLPNRGLQFVRGFTQRRMDLVSYGAIANDAILLGKAIDMAIRGFSGALPDTDATKVDGIQLDEDLMGPSYSDSTRNFYVTFSYLVSYYEP